MGSLIERKKRILMACDPELPPWYQRVEYIKATSAAYLAPNYTPARYDEIEVEYMADAISSYNSLFSAGTGSYQLIALGDVNNGTQKYFVRYFSSSAGELKPLVATGNWYKMTVTSGGKFSVNEHSITKASDGSLDGTATSLFIFRRRNLSYPFIGKLKSFKITNNGTLKLNLIPCIRGSDSKVGVYDTVSKTFFSSESPNEEFTPSTLDT